MDKEVEQIIEKGKRIKLTICKMTSSHKYPSDKKSMILITYTASLQSITHLFIHSYKITYMVQHLR